MLSEVTPASARPQGTIRPNAVEVAVAVEREAVHRDARGDPYPDRRDLAVRSAVVGRRPRPRCGLRPVPAATPRSAQTSGSAPPRAVVRSRRRRPAGRGAGRDDRVAGELTRTVPGDPAAAVDVDDVGAVGRTFPAARCACRRCRPGRARGAGRCPGSRRRPAPVHVRCQSHACSYIHQACRSSKPASSAPVPAIHDIETTAGCRHAARRSWDGIAIDDQSSRESAGDERGTSGGQLARSLAAVRLARDPTALACTTWRAVARLGDACSRSSRAPRWPRGSSCSRSPCTARSTPGYSARRLGRVRLPRAVIGFAAHRLGALARPPDRHRTACPDHRDAAVLRRLVRRDPRLRQRDCRGSLASAVFIELPLAFDVDAAVDQDLRPGRERNGCGPVGQDRLRVPIWKIPLAGVEVGAAAERAAREGGATGRSDRNLTPTGGRPAPQRGRSLVPMATDFTGGNGGQRGHRQLRRYSPRPGLDGAVRHLHVFARDVRRADDPQPGAGH